MTVNQITVVGNLTRTPTLRYTPSGHAVTELTVAENYRRMDPTTRDWRDVSRTYYSVTCWRNLAEHAVQTLHKGHPVIVVGRLYQDEWIGRDGSMRRTLRIDAASVGYDLKYSAALVPQRSAALVEREQPPVGVTPGRSWDGLPEEPPAEPVDGEEQEEVLDDLDARHDLDGDATTVGRELAAVPGSGDRG
ncbi:single-stranded DNA-binding protein [Pseudonocardia nematodicida]|uniref:Single-stranded DNA-binding protein n=1 Tax=Pseudonocardia nematodicida TaxID=1206997 RepID=A0ABV1KKL0_9PSEU